MVRAALKGIRSTLGTAAVQKAPTLTDDIRAMVDAADAGLIGARDRALILLDSRACSGAPSSWAWTCRIARSARMASWVTLRRSKTVE
jgi:hypothetical protein